MCLDETAWELSAAAIRDGDREAGITDLTLMRRAIDAAMGSERHAG
jgi:hypothetical protein